MGPIRVGLCHATARNLHDPLTDTQRKAISRLLTLAGAAFFAMEDSEELPDGSVLLESQHARAVSAALDLLEELPDDQPGLVMSAPAKAAWALRRSSLHPQLNPPVLHAGTVAPL